MDLRRSWLKVGGGKWGVLAFGGVFHRSLLRKGGFGMGGRRPGEGGEGVEKKGESTFW